MKGSERLVRRVSAILIGGLFLAALVSLGLVPLWDVWSSTSASIDRSSRFLDGYQRIIDSKGTTERRLEDLHQRDKGLAGLIDGPTSALAVASLQTDVKRIVEAHGAKIQSMQPGVVSQSHRLERVEVKLDFSVPGGNFANLLDDLDRHQPYLALDPVEIHATDGGQRTDMLTVRMIVSAYRRPAAS